MHCQSLELFQTWRLSKSRIHFKIVLVVIKCSTTFLPSNIWLKVLKGCDYINRTCISRSWTCNTTDISYCSYINQAIIGPRSLALWWWRMEHASYSPLYGGYIQYCLCFCIVEAQSFSFIFIKKRRVFFIYFCIKIWWVSCFTFVWWRSPTFLVKFYMRMGLSSYLLRMMKGV